MPTITTPSSPTPLKRKASALISDRPAKRPHVADLPAASLESHSRYDSFLRTQLQLTPPKTTIPASVNPRGTTAGKSAKLNPDLVIEAAALRMNRPISDVHRIISQIKKGMLPETKPIQIVANGQPRTINVTRHGIGQLKTPYGDFWQYNFHLKDNWGKYTVLIHSNHAPDDDLNPVFDPGKPLMFRIDSGCSSGMKFHDVHCDCSEQLHEAMRKINDYGAGLIIHIPNQDGRGLGEASKIATLALENLLGVNNIEAAVLLHGSNPIDTRTYTGVVGILEYLQIPKHNHLIMLTNNPDKLKLLVENGYEIRRDAIVIPANEHTRHNFQAKQDHLDHIGLLPQERNNG